MYKTGEEFLNKLYSDMHKEDIVESKALKSDSPEEKIRKYLNRLEKIHEESKDNAHRLERLLQVYYDKYVIKELPESYIKLQKEIYKKQGYGNVEINDQMKEDMLKIIQKDQKESLKEWITYLSSDDAMYPMWFKHYVFRGMLKLGKFDKEKMKFTKRTSETVEKYLELNREILAQIYDVLKGEIGENEISKEQEEILNIGESFQKLYLYFLKKQNYKGEDKETEGKWIKYEQGSDSKKLCDSLQGKNTGWCTAGYETAKTQLDNGDFYVYYTKNEEGRYTTPRIAIRMNGKEEIGEVRGVSKNQNLEGNMIEITEKKLDEFEDKEKYKKKVHDMKKLTEIEHKVKDNKKLTIEELRFLYEIESEILGFGFEKDPRIEEIKSKRDMKEDLSIIFGCRKDQIGTTMKDFDERDIEVFTSDFIYKGKIVPEKYRHLKAIIGYADFPSLQDAKGLDHLEYIGGNAQFYSLETAEGLNHLKYIGGEVNFHSLVNAEGLNHLEHIGSSADFYYLTTTEGLDHLEYIGGIARFNSLETAEGLKSLKHIRRDAYFSSLKDAKGLNSLEYIGSYASFESLKDAQNLSSLKYIGGIARFNSLETAKGLKHLKYIGLSAGFESLKDAKDLNSLKYIGGDANFKSLKDTTVLKNCNKYQEIVTNPAGKSK